MFTQCPRHVSNFALTLYIYLVGYFYSPSILFIFFVIFTFCIIIGLQCSVHYSKVTHSHTYVHILFVTSSCSLLFDCRALKAEAVFLIFVFGGPNVQWEPHGRARFCAECFVDMMSFNFHNRMTPLGLALRFY